ncbi:MAG TPA: ABC transporter ATP-binding protein [Trebonia sp.]|nr:ABC transporter ATP-binding protein [Trebonia sp.]
MRASPFPADHHLKPDIRGPWRYLQWTCRRQRGHLAVACIWNSTWTGAQAITPWLMGEAVTAGIVGRSEAALAWWSAAILAVGAVIALSAMGAERAGLLAQMKAGYETIRLVTRHVCDLGASLERQASAGDLVTVGVSDITLIGRALERLARGTGGVTGFLLITVLALSASWQAGLLVLVAVPVILLVTTRLSRALRDRQEQVRAQQRDLTDAAVDIVRGLRVLRGFGGEELFARRYRDGSQALRRASVQQARATAMLSAASTFLPGVLLTAVIALVAQLVLDRQMTAGQMVSFYGYSAYLTSPVSRMTTAASSAMQAHVAAASVTRLLRIEPAARGAAPQAVPAPGDLHDPGSGLRVPARGLTAVVCSAGDAAALADRLGRYGATSVTCGGQPLGDLPLAEVRRRILVTPATARLFAGPLRRELDPRDRADDGALQAAIDAAAARDIIDALPGGLDAAIASGGSDLSGGQQQRLRLARALMADPAALVLDSPTSAVDATTESVMAAGLARLRRGQATVVFTTSRPLLNQADHVALVTDGIVTAQGTHQSLMADLRYRSLVMGGLAGEPEGDPA